MAAAGQHPEVRERQRPPASASACPGHSAAADLCAGGRGQGLQGRRQRRESPLVQPGPRNPPGPSLQPPTNCPPIQVWGTEVRLRKARRPSRLVGFWTSLLPPPSTLIQDSRRPLLYSPCDLGKLCPDGSALRAHGVQLHRLVLGAQVIQQRPAGPRRKGAWLTAGAAKGGGGRDSSGAAAERTCTLQS